MQDNHLPLHEILHRAHEDLTPIVPADDLRLPGGERLASATYVHVHLPVMAASLQGYGFRDSALTSEARALSHLSQEDRWEWLKEGHQATQRGAAWVQPHLSRSTTEYLQSGTDGESLFSHAAISLPHAMPVQYEGGTDRETYGVITRCENNDYLVSMDRASKGEIGPTRRVIGLGAGLSNANSWSQAIVGEPESGINGRWSIRPMTNSPNGPVMVVGIEWQSQASETEAQLAHNAAKSHHLIHETRPDPKPAITIPYTVPILPQIYDRGI